MASAARRPADPKPTPQEWLNVKNDIERLYVVECHNLKYVAHVLRTRRDFVATLRMFKSRIKEWNFDQKTIRQADWQFMFQEYTRRKNLSTPKETEFRVCQDSRGRVAKYKNIKHIRTYMRRKQVSEEEFLSSPSDAGSFDHIRCITPPLSPALSSASPAPSSQLDGYNENSLTPASLVPIPGANGRPIHSSSGHSPTVDFFRQAPSFRAPGSPPTHRRVSTAHGDSFSTSRRENGRSPERVSLRGGHLSSVQSPVTTHEIMLQGSQRMALQTFAPGKDNPYEDAELYRSVAKSPSEGASEASDTDYQRNELAMTLAYLDEEVYEEQDRIIPAYLHSPADVTSAMAQAFRPDVDEARAFRWASMYFLACILGGRTNVALVDAARASASKLFKRMLTSETSSPCAFPKPSYVPSHRSRFILSGLTLMATVLKAHGRDDMLKNFLLDSRRSIAQFFQIDNHPLSAPYTYIHSLMNNEPMDDDAWEETLSVAFRKIRHVWNGGPNAVVSYYYWAWHILKRKRYTEAIAMLNDCYDSASEMFGEYHIMTINCLSTVARALFEKGEAHQAKSCLDDTIRRSQQALGDEHPFCYKLIERVSDIQRQLGDFASAEATLRDVVEGRKKSLGLHHGHTSYAVQKLAEILRLQGKLAESTQLERDLDAEHKEQQLKYYRRQDRYLPDWRQSGSTHASLNMQRLIELH